MVPMGSPKTTRLMLPWVAILNGGGIHDPDAVCEEAIERHLREHLRLGVVNGVSLVDPLDLGGFEERIGMDLHGTEGRRRIGREVGVPRSCREDDDAPLLEVPNGTTADVGFGDLTDLERRLDPSRHPGPLQRVLQGQAVHHCREHPHVVALRSVHPDAGALEAAEDVSPPDDDADLDTESVDLRQLRRGRPKHRRLDTKTPRGTRERLSA